MKRILIIIYLSTIYTAYTKAHTLEDALVSTYENSYNLNAAREELKATDEQVMQALSSWLPDVTLQGQKDFSNIKSFSGNDRPSKTISEGTSKSLSVTQNLFKGGGDVASMKIAKYTIEYGRAQLVKTEQEVLVMAVKVYMKTMQAEEVYKSSLQRESESKRYVEGIKKRFELGQNTKTDVAQAKSSLAEAVAARTRAYSDYKYMLAKFLQVTGIEAQKLTLPKQNLLLPANLDEAIKISGEKNPELAMAINSYESKRIQVNKSFSSLLPKIDFEYSLRDNSQDINEALATGNLARLSSTSAITMTIPVFGHGGAAWSQLRESKRKSKKERYNLDAVRQNTTSEAIAKWQDFSSSNSILSAKNEQFRSAKIAYDGIVAEEQAGIRDTIDVITMRNKYFEAQKEFLEARSEHFINLYELKSQLGECTAQGLGLKVKYHDPLKNYNKIRWQLIGAYTGD